ncbi:MAG: 16S rRNA (adenine(1518)-N(6)/adenine(1519)-N(6))-dimethyltransferase RsmA, partial [Actinomycetota bacterium]
MTLTATRIRDLLAAHDLRPSKALGQHFLADPNTARRIVRLAGVEPGDRIVEVGPGVGSLTVALLDAGARVTALELDRHIVPVLTEVTAGGLIEIVEGDALAVDWSALLPDPGWAMVANLPYNVGTSLLLRALETAPTIDRFLVMVQREVGERLAAGVGDPAYGAVSVRTAWFATATVVGRVPPTVFLPPPKVESALVRLERRPHPPVSVRDPERMFTLVRAGFATRRKTRRNAL